MSDAGYIKVGIYTIEVVGDAMEINVRDDSGQVIEGGTFRTSDLADLIAEYYRDNF